MPSDLSPLLRLALPNDVSPELCRLYETQIQKHNESVKSNPYSNAGFDLYVPEHEIILSQETAMISMKVKAEMQTLDQNGTMPLAYYMYPRSSISKTPLMLANHVGIIDSGYRGELIAAFRNISQSGYTVEKYTRLVQICHPELKSFYVELVKEDSLSVSERGAGGFGSTGK